MPACPGLRSSSELAENKGQKMRDVGTDAGGNFVNRSLFLFVTLAGAGLMTNSGLAQDATFDLRF